MAIQSIGSTSKTKTKSFGSRTYESTKTSSQRQQLFYQTSRAYPYSMLCKYQMSKHHLKKVVPPKKKTHKRSLPKSQPKLKQEEEKTRPPKKKMSPKLQYVKGKAELGEPSSQLRKREKALPSTHWWRNSPHYLMIGNKTQKSQPS